MNRFFRHPKWDRDALIMYDGSARLKHRQNGVFVPWRILSAEHGTSEEALARCLRAVERGNWIEIFDVVLADTPTSEVVPW